MKCILVSLLILIFSMPAFAAKWDPSQEQIIQLNKSLANEINREKVFTEFKKVIDRDMNVNFVDRAGETIPMWFAHAEFQRGEYADPQRPIIFSDWDKKLLKLIVDNGADLNRVFDRSTAAMRAVENYNFEVAKEMVTLGAKHLTSIPTGSFNFEDNLLTYAAKIVDSEAFEYFFNLGGWVSNTPGFCSAGYAARSSNGGSGLGRHKRKILKILNDAGYDWEVCRVTLGLE